MSRTRPIQPGRGRTPGVAVIGGGLVLAGAGVALAAWSLGLLGPMEPQASGIPEGHVAVPVASGAIAAYTAIQLDHLVDPRTGALAVVYLPDGSLLPETVSDAEALLGRVLARDKDPGRVFRESDLLPPGTRPGLVAGIPAGKRALRIDASKVNGIIGLRRGDRFDLVATLRPRRGAPASVSGAGLAPRARVHQVVVDGAVVEPLSQRRLPAASGAGTVVQEMVIAVAPDEVPLLTEALELASRIDCVPRSGHPEERAAASATAEAHFPHRRGFGGEALVDTIEGDQRALRTVPSAELPSVATGRHEGG